MRIAAFDLSLTSTGFAIAVDGAVDSYGLIPGKYTDVARLIYNRNRVCEKIDVWHPDLVVFEDLAFSKNNAFAKEIAGMAYMIRAEFLTEKIPYLVISPTSLKKFVVGTAGSAKHKVTKDLVIKGIYKMGHDVDDNNVADAIGLCYVGMAALQCWNPTTKAQEEVVSGIVAKNPWLRTLEKNS